MGLVLRFVTSEEGVSDKKGQNFFAVFEKKLNFKTFIG